MTARQAAALALLALIWGSSFLFVRVLVDAGMEPFGVSTARSTMGVVSVAPLAWLTRHLFPRDRATVLALVGLGILNFAVPWTLFGTGAQYVPSGVTSIANAAQPLWAALFATFLIRGHTLGRRRAAGLALGFVGVVVLMEGQIAAIDREALLGVPLMVLATACYGISVVSIRRWLSHVPAVPLTVGQLGVAAVVLLPIALATGSFEGMTFGAGEWVSLLLLGFGASGVSVVLYMWLIGQMGPVRAAAVTYLIPLVGVFLGWLVLDEAIGWPVLAGLFLIVGGVALVQGRGTLPRPRRVWAARLATGPAGDG